MTDTSPTQAQALDDLRRPARTQWLDIWDQFKVHKGAMVGMGFFLFILLFVILGPLLWPIDPTYIDIRARNSGPTLAHPFGTDQLGRDMFARMMAGGQVWGCDGRRSGKGL